MDDEIMKYRKKSKKHGLKRSKHKHDYQPCVYNYLSVGYDSTYGFVPEEQTTIGQYCIVCGRIKFDAPDVYKYKWYYGIITKPNDLVKKELNPETRTLPTFKIDDYWNQKFIEVN
ncbi:MAG TPA: hypothetical protein DCW90_05320 [Lachnospiraceae bacterium]|nr:hypothetical protein [Lachnospiraceae bacterium]